MVVRLEDNRETWERELYEGLMNGTFSSKVGVKYFPLRDFIKKQRDDEAKRAFKAGMVLARDIASTHEEDEELGYCDTGSDMELACRSECVDMAVDRINAYIKKYEPKV